MDPLEDDTTYVIRLDMARLRARFKVATDQGVEDLLMEYGVLRDVSLGIGLARAELSWPSNPARYSRSGRRNRPAFCY